MNSQFNEDYRFEGTKGKIFDRALELFTQFGYEAVAIKDIADAVGIMQSSIYNHFPSKRSILDTMYGYYVAHFKNNAASVEYVKNVLVNGSREDFFSALMFTFESENETHYLRMVLLSKLIYMRLFQDEAARDIYLGAMNAEVRDYVVEVLEHGISAGILREFDIATYADILLGQRHIMGINAFAGADYRPEQLEEEQRLKRMIMNMLPYKDPCHPDEDTLLS